MTMSKSTRTPKEIDAAPQEEVILDEDGELSSQELIFCEQLSLGMSKRQAAKLAKYRQPTQAAGRLLKRPRVRKYLQNLYNEAKAKTGLTRDHVVTGLQEAIADAKMQSDCASQIAGWREIGKILGIYAPVEKKVTFGGHLSDTVQLIASMDEKKLLEMVGDEALEGEFTIVENEDTDSAKS